MLAAGCIVILMFNIGGDTVRRLCLVLLILGGCFGMATAVLERLGMLGFNYSYDDRKGLWFKLAQQCAESETRIWGRIFSSKYYDNYISKSEDES